MKKVLKNAIVVAGGVAGVRVARGVTLPLVDRVAGALLAKLPAAANAFIGDAMIVGHAVAGLAVGHKVGNFVTSKLG